MNKHIRKTNTEMHTMDLFREKFLMSKKGEDLLSDHLNIMGHNKCKEVVDMRDKKIPKKHNFFRAAYPSALSKEWKEYTLGVVLYRIENSVFCVYDVKEEPHRIK